MVLRLRSDTAARPASTAGGPRGRLHRHVAANVAARGIALDLFSLLCGRTLIWLGFLGIDDVVVLASRRSGWMLLWIRMRLAKRRRSYSRRDRALADRDTGRRNSDRNRLARREETTRRFGATCLPLSPGSMRSHARQRSSCLRSKGQARSMALARLLWTTSR